MHESSKTSFSGCAGHNGDGRCVVPDDMIMDSTKQGGAGLGSLTYEPLASTVEMLTHALGDRPPDAIPFQNRHGLLVGRRDRGCWPGGDGAKIIAQQIG